ncbi:MAG: glycosyltransferase family 39 protein, partial [Chloroflexi bacterium]|nr:glycosyltransferase family 39 protein [Chloroflexota bacterium]
MPYIYGLPQRLFGAGLVTGRLTSFLFGLLTSLLMTKLARHFAGDMAAVLALAICCTTAIFFWMFSTTRTEPLVTTLAMIALYFLMAEGKEPIASLLASSAMVWAAATRVSCLPAMLCIVGCSLYKNRASSTRMALILLLVLLQILLLFGLPFVKSPERVLFNVFTSQLQRHRQLKEVPVQPPIAFWLHRLAEMLAYFAWYYPALFGAAIIIGVFVPLQWGAQGLPRILQRKRHYLVLIGVAMVLYLPNLSVPENFQA